MTQDITMSDFFCGAGGSSTGARKALADSGGRVVMAANHWQRAIETHQTNHPDVEHDIADLQATHPSRYPRTTICWMSPECTNHSLAKGRKRKNLSQLDLWGEHKIDPAEERSRATMREVIEFTAYHHYEIVIVENVVDIRYWEHYDQWLTEMHNLGYEHKALYLNAMFFGVPQSRDRIYVVFWKKGNKAPDLEFRPYAFCIDHGVVGAVQSFKKAQHWGRYGKKRQYVYCCPTCGRILDPFTRPASDVIDWAIPSQRIGDRERPLKPKTINRILEGLKRFAPEAVVVDSSYSHAEDSGKTRSAGAPLMTQTTRQTLGLVNPFLVSYMNQKNPPRSVDEPLYTLPTLNAVGLVQPQMRTAQTPDESFWNLPANAGRRKPISAAFIAELRKNSSARDVDEPLATITAGGGHHALVSPFLMAFKNAEQGRMPILGMDDPLSTIVAGGGSQHALITPFMVVMKDSTHGLLPPYSLDAPLTTVVAAGSQHALITPFVMAYYGTSPTYAAVHEPIPTVSSVEKHALIEPEALLENCGFRMLVSEELKRGMSFPDDYVITGNKRDQVKQVGNAVACNVAQAIVERCVAALA